MIHPVILSGGSGTRLWPLSRHNQPKQFLPLFGDHSLFQEAALRSARIAGAQPPVVVCSDDHRFMAGEQLQQCDINPGAMLLEPCARNTAPAIALAALHLLQEDADATMLVQPADHLVSDQAAFAEAVVRAASLAEDGWLVTFGITPSQPETGYGYIQQGEALSEGAFRARRFVEKPDQATAESYLESGDFAWNSGMFVFRAQAYLEALGLHAPEILAAAQASWESAKSDLDFIRVDADAFAACPGDSIDYAVMEKAERVAVVPVDCGWSDVGSWSAIWEASLGDEHGNHHQGDVWALDCRGNFVRASDRRMIATIGVEDLVVVDTPDAVLVAHKDRVQDVKKIVDEIKASGRPEHQFHRKVYRPWGSYDSVDMGERFQVKRIVVKPGAALSLQKHHKRAEHWVVVSGTAEVTCDDRVFDLHENESTFIPLGSVHRLRNTGSQPVELIEVQSGSYLGEDDIVRLEDVYGRIEAKA